MIQKVLALCVIPTTQYSRYTATKKFMPKHIINKVRPGV